MIFDSLQNALAYEGMHPRFRDAFAFIARATREDLPAGRYELDGDKLFATIQEYDTKVSADARFEGHRRYIDIQYILRGEELMLVCSDANTSPTTAYSDEKDVIFFADPTSPSASIVGAGAFGIFYPWDLHKPGLTPDGTPAPVKKVLVKIAI